MSEVSFISSSPKWALPYLFSGQSQKEVFVNEALALLDCVVACKVEAVSAAPPASPLNGQAWLVGQGASGAWNGYDGAIAQWRGGAWVFVPPVDGMQVFVQAEQRYIHYNAGWISPTLSIAFTETAQADTSARQAILAIEACLKQAGIIAP